MRYKSDSSVRHNSRYPIQVGQGVLVPGGRHGCRDWSGNRSVRTASTRVTEQRGAVLLVTDSDYERFRRITGTGPDLILVVRRDSTIENPHRSTFGPSRINKEPGSHR
jgi:hypothetical protein